MPDLPVTTDPEIVAFVASHATLLDLIGSLVDDSDCRFDHHGGCQEHGYLSLAPGELCPHEEAKRLLDACDVETGGGHAD